MRALEKYLGLSGLNYNADKKVAIFKERIPKVKAVVDSSAPRSIHDRESMSPGKRNSKKIERNRLIALDNMLLAQRIFSIMEQPGTIHEVVNDTRHLDAHAGTMNFTHRLEEAQRIHRHNQLIAARLDNVKGVLNKEDLFNSKQFNPLEVKVQRCRDKMKKLADLRAKKGFVPPVWDDTPLHSARGEDESRGGRRRGRDRDSVNRASHMPPPSGSQSARRADSPSTAMPSHVNQQPNTARSASPTGPRVPSAAKIRPIRILLEYTKIQNGRVLDLAVVKEPFRDRFAVFGIDIDGGQRYELRLTSEEVSSILDGDLLVTSIESLEVWVALLNKVVLQPVAEFTKLPTHENPEEIIRNTASTNGRSAAAKPTPPTSRPASKARGSRPGSRVKDASATAAEEQPASSDASSDARGSNEASPPRSAQSQFRVPKPPSRPPPDAAADPSDGGRPKTASRTPTRSSTANAASVDHLSAFDGQAEPLSFPDEDAEEVDGEVPEEAHLSPAKEVKDQPETV